MMIPAICRNDCFMQERLLYRLSISNYRERFILKGGALLILTLPVSAYQWI